MVEKKEEVTGISPFLEKMSELKEEEKGEKKEPVFSFLDYMQKHPPKEMGPKEWDQMLTDLIVDFIRGMDDVRKARKLERWTQDDLVGIIHGMFNGNFPR
jgi:hypothetical protein